MTDAYRSDREAAHAHLDALLADNDALRRRVRSLETGGGPAAIPPRRSPHPLLVGVLLGTGAAVVSFSALTSRCPGRARAMHAPCPYAQQQYAAPAEFAAEAPPEVPAEPADATERVAKVLHDSGAIAWCWSEQRRSAPAREGESFTVTVDVAASGTASAAVSGTQRTGLDACIRGHVAAMTFPAGAPARRTLSFAPVGDRLWLGTEALHCPYPW